MPSRGAKAVAVKGALWFSVQPVYAGDVVKVYVPVQVELPGGGTVPVIENRKELLLPASLSSKVPSAAIWPVRYAEPPPPDRFGHRTS